MPLKYTFKNERKTVLRVFESRAEKRAKHVRAKLLSDTAFLADQGPLDGFAVVVWDKTGAWNAGIYPGHATGLSTMPEFVAGALRRRICEDDACRALGITSDEDEPDGAA